MKSRENAHETQHRDFEGAKRKNHEDFISS